MDLSASHTGYVVAAYALSLLGLGGLTAIILWRDAKRRREAADLDRREDGS